MNRVDPEAGPILQAVKEGNQLCVVNVLHLPADPADQVVVVVPGDLVDQLPVTDVRHQDQALLGQKVKRPVDGGLGQPRELAVDLLEDFARGEMFLSFDKHAQDGQALGGQAKALGAEMVEIVFGNRHGCKYSLLQLDAIKASIP